MIRQCTIGLSLLLCACNFPTSNSELDRLRAEIKDIQTDAERKQQLVKSLTEQVIEHRRKLGLIEIEKTLASYASFDTTDRGFQRVDHNLGFFLVSLQDVQPYGDGQRVTLHFGNPLNVTFVGVQFEAVWSGRYPEGKEGETPEEAEKKQQEWEQTKRSKIINLEKKLMPGSWNAVQIVVAPAPSDKFANLTVQKVKISGVELRK